MWAVFVSGRGSGDKGLSGKYQPTGRWAGLTDYFKKLPATNTAVIVIGGVCSGGGSGNEGCCFDGLIKLFHSYSVCPKQIPPLDVWAVFVSGR